MATGTKRDLRKVLARLMMPPDRLLAVDVGSRVIKIAELRRRKDALDVVIADAMPVRSVSAHGDVTPEQITAALRKLLHKHGIKSGSFVSILPREFVTIKRFELPSTDRGQIAQMVPFEAEKHLPFPVDRAQVDFAFVPFEGGGAVQAAAGAPPQPVQRSMVTLAAARQAVIPKFLELLVVKGFKQSAIDISTFAVYNAFTYHLRKHPEDTGQGDSLIVEIGAQRTEVLLVSSATGELLFSRAIDFGGDVLTDYLVKHEKLSFEEAEKRKCETWDGTLFGRKPGALAEAAAPLLEQVEKTIAYLRSTRLSETVGAIWFSGGTGSAPGLAELAAERLKAPVRVFNPLELLGAQAYSAAPSSFTAVMGVALRIAREARIAVDLLPVDISKLQVLAVRKRRLVQLGIAVAGALALWLLWFGVDVLRASTERNALVKEYRLLSPQIDRVEFLEREYSALSNDVTEMEKLMDVKTSWTRVLQTIAERMNTNVWVRKIEVRSTAQKRTKLLTIRTSAVSTVDYIEFKNKMVDTLRFDNVDVRDVVNMPDESVQFTLECDVLPDYKYDEKLAGAVEQIRGNTAPDSGTPAGVLGADATSKAGTAMPAEDRAKTVEARTPTAVTNEAVPQVEARPQPDVPAKAAEAIARSETERPVPNAPRPGVSKGPKGPKPPKARGGRATNAVTGAAQP